MSAVTNLIKVSIILALLVNSCTHDRDNIYDPGNDAYVPLKAPSNFSVKAISPKTITLSWSDINNREEAHIILKGRDSLILSPVVTLSDGTTSWIDTACLPFTEYFYKLAVVGVLEDTHKTNKTLRIRTPYITPLDIPATTTISAPVHLRIVRTSEMALSLSWPLQAGNTKKVLLMKGFKSDSLSVYKILDSTVAIFNDTMHERRNHYYSVSLFDSSSRSNATPEWISPLVPPTNLQIESRDTLAFCVWMGTIGTTDSILLERWTSDDSSWNIRNCFSPGTAIFVDRNLKAYTEYRYRATTFSGTVFSEKSNEDTVGFGSTIPPEKDSNTLFLCRFNQQIGDSIPEETGKTKVLLSGAIRQSGKFGTAIVTGSNKAATATGRIYYPDTSIYVDFWIKPSDTLNLSTERVGLLHAVPGPFRIYYYQGKLIAEWRNTNGNYRAIFVCHKFVTEKWSHIVFMLHDTKSSLFIDDSLSAFVEGLNFPLDATQDTLHIGRAKFNDIDDVNYKYFNGLIDEVLIMSKPLKFFISKL
jgi:hypothetical protein